MNALLRTVEEHIYSSGDLYFSDLIESVSRAKSSVEISVYIFEADEWGKRLIDELILAQRRGVKCRLLIDGVGSSSFSSNFDDSLSEAGVEWAYYHPLPWQRLQRFSKKFAGKMTVQRKLTGFWARVNRRNHCKIFIIDKVCFYSGSINITKDHSESLSKNPFHDFGIKKTTESVVVLLRAFEWVWNRSHRRKIKYDIPKIQYQGIFLNYTIPLRRQLNHFYIHALANAKSEITLVTPYFVPPRILLRSLFKAQKRGVKIRLLTTKKTDVKISRIFARFYHLELISKGVEVCEYQENRVLHAKASLVDDRYFIGSTNFNYRSFFHDLEVAIELETELAKNQLRECVEKYFSLSKQVSYEQLRNEVSVFDRLIRRFFFFLRYFL